MTSHLALFSVQAPQLIRLVNLYASCMASNFVCFSVFLLCIKSILWATIATLIQKIKNQGKEKREKRKKKKIYVNEWSNAFVINERWREQQTKMGGLLAFGILLLRAVSLLFVFASCMLIFGVLLVIYLDACFILAIRSAPGTFLPRTIYNLYTCIYFCDYVVWIWKPFR